MASSRCFDFKMWYKMIFILPSTVLVLSSHHTKQEQLYTEYIILQRIKMIASG